MVLASNALESMNQFDSITKAAELKPDDAAIIVGFTPNQGTSLPIVHVAAAFSTAFGHNPSALVGGSFPLLLEKSARGLVFQRLLQSLQAGQVVETNLPIIRVDGMVRRVPVRLSPLRVDRNLPTHFIILANPTAQTPERPNSKKNASVSPFKIIKMLETSLESKISEALTAPANTSTTEKPTSTPAAANSIWRLFAKDKPANPKDPVATDPVTEPVAAAPLPTPAPDPAPSSPAMATDAAPTVAADALDTPPPSQPSVVPESSPLDSLSAAEVYTHPEPMMIYSITAVESEASPVAATPAPLSFSNPDETTPAIETAPEPVITATDNITTEPAAVAAPAPLEESISAVVLEPELVPEPIIETAPEPEVNDTDNPVSEAPAVEAIEVEPAAVVAPELLEEPISAVVPEPELVPEPIIETAPEPVITATDNITAEPAPLPAPAPEETAAAVNDSAPTTEIMVNEVNEENTIISLNAIDNSIKLKDWEEQPIADRVTPSADDAAATRLQSGAWCAPELGSDYLMSYTLLVEPNDSLLVLDVKRAGEAEDINAWLKPGIRFADVLPERVLRAVLRPFSQARATGKPVLYRESQRLGDIERAWQTRIFPLLSANGDVSVMLALVEEVTTKHLGAPSIYDQAGINAALADVALLALNSATIEEVFDHAVSCMRRVLDCDIVGLYQSVGEMLQLSASRGYGAEELTALPLASLMPEAFSGHQPLVLGSDLPLFDNAQAPNESLAAQNIHSAITAPLLDNGKLVGVLAAFSRTPVIVNAGQKDFMRRLSHILSARLGITRSVVQGIDPSKDMLPAIMETADAGIIIVRDDATIDRVNATAARLFGLDEKTVAGMACSNLLHDEGQTLLNRMVHQFINGRIAQYEEFSGTLPNGRKIDFSFSAKAFVRADNARLLVLMVRDVSRRTQIEERLRLIESAVANSNDAVIITDAVYVPNQGPTIVYVNRAFTRITGYTAEEAMGKSPRLLLHGEKTDADKLQVLRNALENRSPHTVDLIHYRKDGSEFWAGITIVPVLNSDGVCTHFVTTLRDISQKIKGEMDLRAARDRAELASRSKSEFLANMSHELRTPLNAIIGFSEMMQNQVFGPLGAKKYYDYTQHIIDSSQHLIEVIGDILDLAKIEAGRLELREAPVDLHDVLKSSLALLRERAMLKNVSLHKQLPEQPIKIMADGTKIKQIVLNILTNAVKFTPEGGRVDMTLSHSDGEAIKIVVTDTGIGIKPEDIATVLTPFAQADNLFVRSQEGTGLGLPLAKAMLELHGGELKLDSTHGLGTTVTMLIPASRLIRNTAALHPLPEQPKSSKAAS